MLPVVNDLGFTNDLSKFLIMSLANMNTYLYMGIENVYFNTLLQLVSLNVRINSPTCYQSCFDHILTNQKSLFKFSKMLETGLFDNHKLISTTIKSGSF